MDERNDMPREDDVTQSAQASILKKFWSNFGYLIIPVVIVFILLKVIFSLAYVPSGSMETTLPTNSLFFGYRLEYLMSDPTPERGDIIMFKSEELGKVLVKRVIGLPGDTVYFQDGYVYVNGEQLDESYLPGTEGSTWPQNNDDTFEVPDGCVFVMGDNRTDSYDSRFWSNPYVEVSSIQSKALVDIAVLPSCSRRGVFVVA
ncbi:MAG: signal peptidase I [Oscillospiraceae bacterium]|nr:signal peptidase I [Oscillospiraceae bacterium]